MIDFPCHGCGKMLRVPPDAAGKQAQCPACGIVQPVPAGPTAEPGVNPFHLPQPAGVPPGANPYAGAAYDTGVSIEAARQEIVPTLLDLSRVLSHAWAIARTQIPWLFLLGLIYLVASWVIGMGVQMPFSIAQLAFNLRGPAVEISFALAANAIGQLVGLFLTLGALIYSLKMARGQQASYLDLLTGAPYMIRAVGINLIFGAAGLCLLIVAGLPAGVSALTVGPDTPVTIALLIVGLLIAICAWIVVLLVFSQSMIVLVDRDVGVIESLATSRRITAGNRLTLFALYALLAILAVVGFCALCFPYFFVMGFGLLVAAVAYLAMTGQPVAVPITPPAPMPQQMAPPQAPEPPSPPEEPPT